MPSYGNLVTLEHRVDGVALITLHNEPVNALTTPVFAELLAIAQSLQADPPGAVVLAGQPKVFALGGEISETQRIRFAGRSDTASAGNGAPGVKFPPLVPGYMAHFAERVKRESSGSQASRQRRWA